MSEAETLARRHWAGALRAAQAVVREPGILPAREQELLRTAVVPQLECALALVDAGTGPEALASWHAFLPAAIDSLGGRAGLDAGLVTAREHVRRGLDALA